MKHNPKDHTYWWERDDLKYINGSLHLVNHSLKNENVSDAIPTYFYSAPRILENLQRLLTALDSHKIPSRIFYAMKANRFPPVLKLLEQTQQCGIDACSPGEIDLALQCDFKPENISFTGTALSSSDLEALGKYPDIIVNLDSISAIRRWGERFPNTSIGFRVNPEFGLGYRDNTQLQYAGQQETKFGIYLAQLPDALSTAKALGLTVNGLHVHAGCGYLDTKPLARLLEHIDRFINQMPPLDYINLGGGLGIPLIREDTALDLDAWCKTIETFAQKHKTHLYFEPGDYLVKDAGVLVTTVTMVERKRETCFVGLNAGFNTHIEPAFYQLPLEPVPLIEPQTDPSTWPTVTLSGNINEALDVFARDIQLPPVKEGDKLCLLNAGGYGASMASNHCLRPLPEERLLV